MLLLAGIVADRPRAGPASVGWHFNLNFRTGSDSDSESDRGESHWQSGESELGHRLGLQVGLIGVTGVAASAISMMPLPP